MNKKDPFFFLGEQGLSHISLHLGFKRITSRTTLQRIFGLKRIMFRTTFSENIGFKRIIFRAIFFSRGNSKGHPWPAALSVGLPLRHGERGALRRLAVLNGRRRERGAVTGLQPNHLVWGLGCRGQKYPDPATPSETRQPNVQKHFYGVATRNPTPPPCAPQPLNPSTPQPLNPSTPQPLNPSTPQPLNPSTPQPLNPSTPQPLNPSTPQPLNPSTPQPLNPSTPQPLNPSTPQPLNPSTPQPLSPSAPQPLSPSAPQPLSPSTPQPLSPKP